MSSDFSKRIESVLAIHNDLLQGSDSDSPNDTPSAITSKHGQKTDISSRLQNLLSIREQLLEDSDSSDDGHLFTDEPRVAALFSQRGDGLSNDKLLRALCDTSEEDASESEASAIRTPTEEDRTNTEDEFLPDSPGVTFEHDPSGHLGENETHEDPTYLAGETLPIETETDSLMTFSKIASLPIQPTGL
jgi:hypothetical protein